MNLPLNQIKIGFTPKSLFIISVICIISYSSCSSEKSNSNSITTYEELVKWHDEISITDSTWISLRLSKFDWNINNSQFTLNYIGDSVITRSLEEYTSYKRIMPEIKKKIINSEQIHVSGAENEIFGLWVTNYVDYSDDCTDLIKNIKWTKWVKPEQDIDLTNWEQYGEWDLKFVLSSECLQDCLIVITDPNYTFFLDDFEQGSSESRPYKNRSLPIGFEKGMNETLWAYDFSRIDLDKAAILAYLKNKRQNLPTSWKINSGYFESNKSEITVNFSDLIKLKSSYFTREKVQLIHSKVRDEIQRRKMLDLQREKDKDLEGSRAKLSGLSPACFCSKVLASPSEHSLDEVNKCLKMYKCFDNASTDCMAKTEHIWYRCE